jgi:hypothetical protein
MCECVRFGESDSRCLYLRLLIKDGNASVPLVKDEQRDVNTRHTDLSVETVLDKGLERSSEADVESGRQ